MITRQHILALSASQNISILETYKNMPKVIETSTGDIIKFFYAKKWPSSDYYRPYALRFYENAVHLRNLGFDAPEMSALNCCLDLKIYLARYKKIMGENIFSLVENGDKNIIKDVLKFVNLLHEKGVYFRSLHFSNLLFQDNGRIALIDITDMEFKNKPLSLYLRFRNLKSLFSHRIDIHTLKKIGIHYSLNLYNEHSNLSSLQKKILSFFLLRKMKQT